MNLNGLNINEIFSPSILRYFPVISPVIFLMLLVNLVYMGMAAGTAFLSVIYHKRKPEMSKYLVSLVIPNNWVWIIFGMIPMFCLGLLYKMLLSAMQVSVHLFFIRLLGMMLIGFVFLAIYRRTHLVIAGVLGLLTFLGYAIHLTGVFSLLLYPEKWPFVQALVPDPLMTVNTVFEFFNFLCLSALLTGGIILFLGFHWGEKKLDEDVAYRNFLKVHAYVLLLGGSLALPVGILLDLFNIPGHALSIALFVQDGFSIVVLGITGYLSIYMMMDRESKTPRFGLLSFILALVITGLLTASLRVLETTANLETIRAGEMKAEKKMMKEISRREAIYSKSMKVDEKMGEQIFNERCTACHSFDKKVLGPPYNSVLPKYIDNQERLIAYILNPVKVDPQYPAMPSPGLSPIQVKSVVRFLMIKIGAKPLEEREEQKEKNEGGGGRD